MIYPEKAYISAAQALVRATTEQAARTRARIIELMIQAEQPADRARARELVAEEEEPPDQGRTPFFLQAARLIHASRFHPPEPKTQIQNVPTAKQPAHASLHFEHSRDHA